jgi:hypothetical protein
MGVRDEIAPSGATRFERDARRHVWSPSRVGLARYASVRNASGRRRDFEGHDLGGHYDINASPFRSRHVRRQPNHLPL